MSRRRNYLLLVFLAVWFLAIALPSLRFDGGGFKDFRQNWAELDAFGNLRDRTLVVMIGMAITGLAWYLMATGKVRRKNESSSIVLASVASVVVILILLSVVDLVRSHRQFRSSLPPLPGESHLLPLSPTSLPGNAFQDPNSGDWITYVSIIIGFMAFCWIARVLFKRWRQKEESPDLKEVTQITEKAIADHEDGLALSDVVMRCYHDTEKAIADLEGGLSLSDVVMHCYHDMAVILGRKVNFGEAMTTREFEQALLQTGVNESAVATLTELFERVRYGGHSSGPEDRTKAIAALKAIEQKYKEAEHAD